MGCVGHCTWHCVELIVQTGIEGTGARHRILVMNLTR